MQSVGRTMSKPNYPSTKISQARKEGFTLIELALSIAFLGILSLTIALIINDTVGTYRRGLTLNQVNTVGMDLVDDMRTAFQNSSAKSVMSECESLYEDVSSRTECEEDFGKNLVSVTKYAKVTVKKDADKTYDNAPVYGAICTGSYSYIWNSGYFFSPRGEYAVEPNTQATFVLGSNTYSGFRLLKVQDRNRGVCAYSMAESVGGNLSSVILSYAKGNITRRSDGIFVNSPNETITEDPITLLAEDNNDTTLALYDLQSNAPIQSNANNSLFYSVSFILGTIEGGVDIMSKGNFCSTPDEYKDSNLDYCAINKFNFAVQATGE